MVPLILWIFWLSMCQNTIMGSVDIHTLSVFKLGLCLNQAASGIFELGTVELMSLVRRTVVAVSFVVVRGKAAVPRRLRGSCDYFCRDFQKPCSRARPRAMHDSPAMYIIANATRATPGCVRMTHRLGQFKGRPRALESKCSLQVPGLGFRSDAGSGQDVSPVHLPGFQAPSRLKNYID